MYKIKQVPEDFIVKEELKVNLKEKGKFTYFMLRKKNWATQMAVSKIADTLRINEKRFSYAGQKDKNAVTEQYIAAEGLPLKSVENLRIRDISLKPLGYSDSPIRLGSVDSNYFSITIRNLEKPLNRIESFCNYYDGQRFGGIRPANAIIGKFLLKNDFELALKNYLCYPFSEETNEHKKFREEILGQWGGFKGLLIPGYLPNERKVIFHLSKNPKDFIGAFKLIPKRISTMFIQSYQSLIFNQLLSDYVQENFKDCYKIKTNVGEFYCTDSYFDKKFPLPGYDFKDEILKEDGIKMKDFNVKEIPYLSSRTTYRDACVRLDNLSLSELKDDELNNGKKKQLASFSLPSGSYATIVVKCLAKE